MCSNYERLDLDPIHKKVMIPTAMETPFLRSIFRKYSIKA